MAIIFSVEDGNTVNVAPEGRRKSLRVLGRDNRIQVGEGADVSGLQFEVSGTGHTIEIGRHCKLRGRVLVKGKGSRVVIGDHTTFADVYILCDEGCDVVIGKWCMFSRKIEVRSTDAHSLLDAKTGKRLNVPASIHIGHHVWVSLDVIINKGVTIADDNVIGAGSFVNRSVLQSQVIIAGAPAKVVKEGVTWQRQRKARFTRDEMNQWRKDVEAGAPAEDGPDRPGA